MTKLKTDIGRKNTIIEYSNIVWDSLSWHLLPGLSGAGRGYDPLYERLAHPVIGDVWGDTADKGGPENSPSQTV